MKNLLIASSLILLGLTATAQTDVPATSRPAAKSKADSVLQAITGRARAARPDSGNRPQRTQRPFPSNLPNDGAPKRSAADSATVDKATTAAPQAATPAAASTAPATTGTFAISNFDHGPNVTITQCVGNTHDQSVTVYFTFANPDRSHQMITMGFQAAGYKTSALDKTSNVYEAGSMTLGGETNTSRYKFLSKQLPTGNTLNGSVTFTNILPAIQQLSQIYLITETKNWVGGQSKYGGLIEIANAPITWK